MSFGIFILLRVLFAACMVFVIGYVFGSFSKNATLTTLTKIAAILAIVLFFATNIIRSGGRRYAARAGYECGYFQKDSTVKQQPAIR